MAVPLKLLGDIAQIYVGLPTKVADSAQVGRSGNVLTVRSLTGTGIDPAALSVVHFNRHDLAKYQAAPGDVLISARSTSLKTAIVPETLAGKVVNATLLGVRCLPVLESRLLVAWLNHPEGRAALEDVSQSATLQMNITVSGLSRLEIPVPPMNEQKRLVELLKSADEAYATATQAAESRRQMARQVVVSQLLIGRDLQWSRN